MQKTKTAHQDKLYSDLAQHGVTAEDVHRIIMENNDNAIVKEIIKLQKAKIIFANNSKSSLTLTKLNPLKPT